MKGSIENVDDHGIDRSDPCVTSTVENVDVPTIQCFLTEQQLSELKDMIDPMHNYDYGFSLYMTARAC